MNRFDTFIAPLVAPAYHLQRLIFSRWALALALTLLSLYLWTSGTAQFDLADAAFMRLWRWWFYVVVPIWAGLIIANLRRRS